MPILSPGKKTAIVLMNLGGPDNPAAVQPFLFNLFNDKAIIGLAQPFRFLLATLIAKKRAAKAQGIYAQLGGKSPLLENTQAQAKALEQALRAHGEAKVFIAMRYWHPMTAQAVTQVKEYAPDTIILLPLYPQYSASTTGSSLDAWRKEAKRQGLHVPTATCCCYPTQEQFIAAHVALISRAMTEAGGPCRILFSAHGLPEKNIRAGDPYQWQVEQTTQAIVQALGLHDYVNCYQSRVGPLAWIGPSTESELRRAAADKVPVVLVPIAFVSEHSETLVELDVEYAHLAKEAGLATYVRVPTLSVVPDFIAALASLCLKAEVASCPHSSTGMRCCPKQFTKCPMALSSRFAKQYREPREKIPQKV